MLSKNKLLILIFRIWVMNTEFTEITCWYSTTSDQWLDFESLISKNNLISKLIKSWLSKYKSWFIDIKSCRISSYWYSKTIFWYPNQKTIFKIISDIRKYNFWDKKINSYYRRIPKNIKTVSHRYMYMAPWYCAVTWTRNIVGTDYYFVLISNFLE